MYMMNQQQFYMPQQQMQMQIPQNMQMQMQLQQQQQQQQQQQMQHHQQQQQPIVQNHVNSPKMTKENKGKKPKGRMSAYTFFVQTCREEHRKKHPNENVNFTEFSKKCAERWKQMTENEKKRFAAMAEKDKARYDKEMASYTPPAGEGGRKRKKKDPNAPKRPLSAFFLFCHDERPAVKAIYPTYGVGDVAKELGDRWNKVTPETKSKYEAKAQVDKGRYEKDMEAYKIKKAGGTVPAAAVEEEDDDEEDEE